MMLDGNKNITQQQRRRRQQQQSNSTSLNTGTIPKDLSKWLDLSLPEGRCLGVHVLAQDDGDNNSFPKGDTMNPLPDDHWIHSVFHPDEVALAKTMREMPRKSFWLGRLAMRMALDFPDYPIVRDSYGRPQLTFGLCGSISHKQNRGIALVSSVLEDEQSGAKLTGVGVDLELTSRPGRSSIAKRILTQHEILTLGNIPGISIDEEVYLRFR
jgi:4'-phosphopantetheinyl transferase EntD